MDLQLDTLFHFTNKEEHLLNIIKNSFSPRFCLDDFTFFMPKNRRGLWVKPPIMLAMPMVCFCNIELGELKYHSNKYGRFIIGMKKEWAIRRGISPVMYFHENSTPVSVQIESIYRLMDLVRKGLPSMTMQELADFNVSGPEHIAIIRDIQGALTEMVAYYKPIIGIKRIRGKKERVNYYNEREWRYSPLLLSENERVDNFATAFLFEENYRNSSMRKEEEAKIAKRYTLRITKDDIKYVVLPDKSYLKSFEIKLREGYKDSEVDHLLQKIVFYDEVSK